MRHAACRLGLTLLVTFGALAVPSADAAPRGAVHLARGDFKRVDRHLLCGRVDGRWVAGTRQRTYWFVSHASRAAALRRAGHTSRARAARRRAVVETPACRPLRFNLRGAAAVGVHGSADPRAGDLSNLEVIGRRGAVRDAITSGTANVQRIYTAPGGKVYVLFVAKTPIAGGEVIPNTENLRECDWGSEYDDEGYDEEEYEEGDERRARTAAEDGDGRCYDPDERTPVQYCLLAELDPATQEPTCVDDGLWSVRSATFRGANDAVQFDADGGVYYMGYSNTGPHRYGFVLRRYLDGKRRNYLRDGNMVVDDFLVMDDGNVLVSGVTAATGSRWLRRIGPAGRVFSLWSRSASFMLRFPDGNAYVGHDLGGEPGVGRFDAATRAMDPLAWLNRTRIDELCPEADPAAQVAFCVPAGSRITTAVTTADGRVYAVAGTAGEGRLVQYWPEPELTPTAVRKVSAAALVGDDVALAGVDVDERRILALHDTASDAETLLIGPDAELDVYHLAWDEPAGKLRFDGLRFADNRYVLGEVDLAMGTVTYTETSETRWTDLRSLG